MEVSYGRRSRERRALNIVWTAAGDYSFMPDFLAFHHNGQPDIYLNSIIGFAHRCYDYQRLADYIKQLDKSLLHQMFEDLLWLGLEAALYNRMLPQRPALDRLQQQHARQFLLEDEDVSMQQLMVRNDVIHSLKKARCYEALGQESGLLNPWERGLYQALQYQADWDTEKIIAKTQVILKKYFVLRFTDVLRHRGRLKLGARLSELLRRLMPLERAVGDNYQRLEKGTMGQNGAQELEFSQQLDADKAYQTIQETFGPACISQTRRHQLELLLCTGNHSLCHLYYSHGTQRSQGANLAYYQRHQRIYRTTQRKLVASLKNAMAVYQVPLPLRSLQGKFSPRLAWQATVLQEARVFISQEEEIQNDLAVALVLDSSYSRKDQQEQLAAQAYVIASSLQQCNIPVAVLAYSSLKGYTVLQQLKEFAQSDCQRIFAYEAAGWNRDGLGIRTAGKYLLDSGRQNVLMIVLSDLYPSDDQGIPVEGTILRKDYSGERAIADLETEIKALRRQNIQVAGLINTILPWDGALAHRLFGNGFARIERADQLANAVAGFVAHRIQFS